MPRDGSHIYSIPPGTEGIPDTTIESNAYNIFIHDVETDLNTPRPISAGGTGGSSVDEALLNLGAEKAMQVVTNYDSHLWIPGSFLSAAGATNAPVAGHIFVGHVEIYDANNGVVYAHDLSDTTTPGRLYVREKKAGVWTTGPAWFSQGSDKLPLAGGTMTGFITLHANPTDPMHATPKQYVDRTVYIGDTPPATPAVGSLWWESDSGMLFIWYDDGDTTQWVAAAPQPDIDFYVERDGDTMTGPLTLFGAPTEDLHAATKKYVDQSGFPVGTRLVFNQAAPPPGWSIVSINDHILRVSNVAGGAVGGTVDFTTWAAATVTGNTTLDTTTMAYHSHSVGNAIGSAGAAFWTYAYYATPGSSIYYGISTEYNGGGLPHSHPLSNALKFTDVIICVRDPLP